MKIRTGDIYRIEWSKYYWANQFSFGKVLHITCGKYMNYALSKLLLENNTHEIWNIDILDIQEHITVRKIDKGKIIFQTKNKKELDLMKFDTILAFNILSITDSVDESIKFIFENLNNNGIAIISIINDDKLEHRNDDLVTKDLNIISKNTLQQNLQSYFNNIEFFFQGTIKNENVTNNLRSKITNKITNKYKIYNFYLKYFRASKKNISKIIKNRENKNTHRYEIIPFNEKINPMFTIVKCKK